MTESACPEYFKNFMTVYSDESCRYSCALNYTDISESSNVNKSFIMQLMKHNKGEVYLLVYRSGRVGCESSSGKESYNSQSKALKSFKEKFQEKTGLSWENRRDDCLLGKYVYIEMSGDSTNKDDSDSDSDDDINDNQISLDQSVEKLTSMIFDPKMFEDAMISMKLDRKRAPLGTIGIAQIKKAYRVINDLSELVAEGVDELDRYYQLTSLFYSLIPTSFGMSKPPVIDSIDAISEKMELLKTLEDLSVLGKNKNIVNDKVYRQYLSLNRGIKPLTDSSMQKIILDYVKNTCGKTHSYTLKVNNIFELVHEREDARFNNVGNVQLLWHGSRMVNYVGILTNGLRIQPSCAVSTGAMFGNGCYFADAVTKSANYCYLGSSGGLILLCEVALGNIKQLEYSDSRLKAPPVGYNSVQGLGEYRPKSSVTENNVTIPNGVLEKQDSYKSLLYNEFIVYNVNQIRLKYLLHVSKA